jgi:hypothetical protein
MNFGTFSQAALDLTELSREVSESGYGNSISMDFGVVSVEWRADFESRIIAVTRDVCCWESEHKNTFSLV